jgi:Dyp-type peroxidase family
MTTPLSATAIDPGDPAYEPLLAAIQCNILKSHGRDHAAHVFVQFTAPPDRTRSWVRAAAGQYVTSARTQLTQAAEYKAGGPAGGPVGCPFLSAAGYRHLGYDVDRFPDEYGSFRNGMKYWDSEPLHHLFSAQNRDPLPGEWEPGFRGDIHAMVMVAADDPDDIASACGELEKSTAGVGRVSVVEVGHVLRNEEHVARGTNDRDRKAQPIEHFGFVDGRSNPLFLATDLEHETGTDRYDPRAPLGLVLVRDPFGQGEAAFGSYLVFRKLEQDVPGFKAAVDDLAKQLGVDPELAGALVVGRFRDGTPVALRNVPGLGDVNNFDYRTADAFGDRCPYHAHVRKVNPRGTTPFTPLAEERARRIVRRGIPYGERGADAVGLLFMCYQSDIHRQFEFLQRVWADNPGFPVGLAVPDTGTDALIGQALEGPPQGWPVPWGRSPRTRLRIGSYVTLKGGEYFFAPSISFLRGI